MLIDTSQQRVGTSCQIHEACDLYQAWMRVWFVSEEASYEDRMGYSSGSETEHQHLTIILLNEINSVIN